MRSVAPPQAAAARKTRRGVHPWIAAARVLAALVAGYWVAWGSTAFLTLALPMSRPNRVITASLLCFAVWAAAAMYAFAARGTWRAWWVLLAIGGVLYAIALAFGEQAMRP
ncbi:hypothetical protein [Luteimonas aquatica]|uniref:hypothetical protein n=1 Tax=Luteimonas aquatica TaxID=450364 RepID=UPI001F5743CF|nr:hypothetical protein [Luteimonas aquatica]